MKAYSYLHSLPKLKYSNSKGILESFFKKQHKNKDSGGGEGEGWILEDKK